MVRPSAFMVLTLRPLSESMKFISTDSSTTKFCISRWLPWLCRPIYSLNYHILDFFYRSTISPSQSWCHHRSTWILKEHVAALQWDVSAAKGEVEENIGTWKGSEKIEVNYVVSRDDINGKKMKWSSSSEEFLSWLLNIDYGIWKTSLLNYKFLVKLVVEVVE